MPLGKVQVNNPNLGQGDIPAVERHFLFVGRAGDDKEESTLFSVNANTDLETQFADSNLRDQVIAAQLNGGQNWTAGVYALADGEEITDAIDKANESQSFEAVVVCDVQTTKAAIEAIGDHVFGLRAKLGRFVFSIVALAGIDKDSQTWSDYEAAQIALVKDIAKPFVVPVPQLHGNNVGVLAGRLADHSVSIADSPMRTATGAVRGLGAVPVDSSQVPLQLATLNTLSNNRLSVPQWYPDVEGIYWADGSTLEAKGGDYQYVEIIRPAFKASREVRILAIQRIGNRRLNSTANSISSHKTYFSKPLREMSKSFTIGDDVFPGDIKPPKDGDIEIAWLSRTHVKIGLRVTPYNSPKSITMEILLNLSNQ